MWVLAVMENQITALSLNDEEKEELDFQGTWTESEGLGLSLLERFMTDMVINLLAMKHRMTILWRPTRGVTVKEVQPFLYIFQFFHIVDLQRVMDTGPWSFDGDLLILHHLQSGDSWATILTAIWIMMMITILGFGEII